MCNVYRGFISLASLLQTINEVASKLTLNLYPTIHAYVSIILRNAQPRHDIIPYSAHSVA